jgi:hypothetical protein
MAALERSWKSTRVRNGKATKAPTAANIDRGVASSDELLRKDADYLLFKPEVKL